LFCMARAAILFPILLLAAALAPFGLGVMLAAASGFASPGPALAIELLTVTSLTLAGLASREAYAPGSGRCSSWAGLSRESWARLAYACLTLSGLLAVLLQGFWHTGDFTIPLAAVGLLGGYFIFAPPLAWHRRGLGEFWGGLCFGLLPVAAGYYLQGRHLISETLLYGVPLSLTAFNLLLLLGFPEPGTEPGPEPYSLAVRLGPVAAALVYTLINILVVLALVLNLFFPAANQFGQPWLWALIGLTLVNQELVKRRAYYQPARLTLLSFSTLALHLGMCLVFGLGLWGRL
jgi:1,4-dihydroxy-2-naphthoate octaprenyltransferase